MSNKYRVIGYLVGAGSASLVYMAWLAFSAWTDGKTRGDTTLLFDIGFAFFLWLIGGMAAALVAMALPWYLVVRLYRRLRRFGLAYFSLVGAALVLVLGCVGSSLSPKPLFVDDQSFMEGFMIALQRQGVCFLLCGLVFGVTFWMVSERRRVGS